jgi:enamine deaminase RidA (YjgF/YER057c/UK114 family)
MNKQYFTPKDLYPPTGAYTPAIKVTGGSLLFVSGIVGIEEDGSIASGDIVRQAECAYRNLETVLRAAGGTVSDIVKVNIYIGEDFQVHRETLREVRARFFSAPFPVSTLLQVAGFANPEYLFEIEAIAALPES